jgi:capsule polysaccharide export protein KpsE/RkpR
MHFVLVACVVLFVVTGHRDGFCAGFASELCYCSNCQEGWRTQLDKSAENLRLIMTNQKLKEENNTLEDLHVLLNDRVEGLTKQVKDQESLVHKMQETIDQNNGVLEKLRSTVDKDVIRIKSLEAENKQLKDEGSKKDQLIEKLLKEAEENQSFIDEAVGEIVEKNEQISL